MRRSLLALGALAGLSSAQQAGKDEDGPQVLVHWCDSDGSCEAEEAAFTIDASWRVQHNATKGGWQSCIIQDGMWQSRLCPDPLTCGKHCAVDGMSLDKYAEVHGITELDDGIRLNYITATQYGLNIGSRLYMLDDEYRSYKAFRLKNREFAFDIDVSSLPCGVNAALYLVGMDTDGGKGKGNNDAGAKLGTGYCDAHCPHSSNFIDGEANMDWSYGTCCPEIDLFEGNAKAAAFTAHTCENPGYTRCDHVDCGDSEKGHHYEGICDKDGCDFNSFRMGDMDFYGTGSGFTVDTTKPVTVVTQFLTTDGTDTGDLSEIRRFYVQGGRVIPNSKARILGPSGGNSITDSLCGAQKAKFGDRNDFARKGGLKDMGAALDRGMVLVLSLWDDTDVSMLWLDSAYPTDQPPRKPGVLRGPCPGGAQSEPAYLRATYPDAKVEFSMIKFGTINSTFSSGRRLDSFV